MRRHHEKALLSDGNFGIDGFDRFDAGGCATESGDGGVRFEACAYPQYPIAESAAGTSIAVLEGAAYGIGAEEIGRMLSSLAQRFSVDPSGAREDAEGIIMQARVKAGWISEADLAPPAEEAPAEPSEAQA